MLVFSGWSEKPCGSRNQVLQPSPQGDHYLNVYFLASFPQAKHVRNPSGKIPGKPE
jgi:hypothetical protein